MNQTNLEFLIECACRYNIGRRSYSPHWFCDIVEHYLDTLSSKCLANILHDIRIAKPDKLGREIDANRWLDLKQKIEARLKDEN
jgi:hypothetical protein